LNFALTTFTATGTIPSSRDHNGTLISLRTLTGQRLFGGKTVSDTLAAVLTREPEWVTVPGRLRKLVRHCLTRDPRQRLRDISGARLLLGEQESAPEPRRALLPWIGVAAFALAALFLGFLLWRATSITVGQPLTRFSVDLGPDAIAGDRVTAVISPDGRRLVYSVRGPGGVPLLATRLLDQEKAGVLAGTENAEQPFFSPDGDWIGFYANQKLKKISVQGGAAVVLCDTPNVLRGASWGEDGGIIANLDTLHLFHVPASGAGKPEIIGKPEDHGERTWRWPQILAGRQMVLFSGLSVVPGFEGASIEVLSLRTGQVKLIHRGGYFPRYLPSGHLVYLHQGTLFAVRFDVGRLEMRGAPVPVLEEVSGNIVAGDAQFDFSQTGTFLYLRAVSRSAVSQNLSWLESSGKTIPLWSAPAAVESPKVAPDGTRILASVDGEMLVYDLLRSASTRLTFTPGQQNFSCAWLPGGRHVAFVGHIGNEFTIWLTRADGSTQPQKLFTASAPLLHIAFSPDGRRLAFVRNSPTEVWTLPLDLTNPDHPRPGIPELYIREPFAVGDPAFSPDGRWIAYASVAAPFQIFVRPFPATASGSKWQISSAGGRFPVWASNGRELFYLGNGGTVMVAPYHATGELFAPETPRQWSPTTLVRTLIMPFDLAPDGRRLIVLASPPATEGENKGSIHVTVLLNFFDELKRRVK
jgi:hypothetical protein